MNDRLFNFLQSWIRSKPREELLLLMPNSDSARWVVEQWQKRVDRELLAGVMGKMGSAGTSTNTNWEPDGSLTVESLKQTVKSLLSTVNPYAQAMQRLTERLKRDPSIYYISNEYIPGGSDDGPEFFWWETYDVLLIAAAKLEDVTQQMAQQGIRLIPVDGAWWADANKTLMDSLWSSWESRP